MTPADLAAVDRLCAATGLTVQQLAPAMRATVARLRQDPHMVALAKANSREDFYAGLTIETHWRHVEDAILGAAEDVSKLYDPAVVAPAVIERLREEWA